MWQQQDKLNKASYSKVSWVAVFINYCQWVVLENHEKSVCKSSKTSWIYFQCNTGSRVSCVVPVISAPYVESLASIVHYQSRCILVAWGQMELVERNRFHLFIHTHRRFLRPNRRGGSHVWKVPVLTRHHLSMLLQVIPQFCCYHGVKHGCIPSVYMYHFPRYNPNWITAVVSEVGTWDNLQTFFLWLWLSVAPCGLQGCKNRPAQFPGWMS